MIRKILFLGSGNINPINILCENLIRFGTYKYQFDGLNLYQPGTGGVKNNYQHITNQWLIEEREIKDIPISLIIKLAFHNSIRPQLIKLILRNHFHVGRTWLRFKQLVCRKEWLDKMLTVIQQYDIINIHFLSYWQAEIAIHIPTSKRVVISFWGSDLMSVAGKRIYGLQSDAINRADALTLIGAEMEQILLSKFGRNLKEKIHHVLFGLPQHLVTDLITNAQKYREYGESLLKAHGLSTKGYPYRIKLGYSAFESQNHLKIISQLGLLNADIRKQILLIVPMTYGGTREGYKEEVEHAIEQAHIKGLVLKEYLNNEQAISLSYITNIMFNLRDNDAFNNSMSESLIAGSLVFNGLWLPYKILQEHDIYYINVSKIEDLSEVFSNTISCFAQHLERSQHNSEKLNGWITGRANVLQWERALHSSPQ